MLDHQLTAMCIHLMICFGYSQTVTVQPFEIHIERVADGSNYGT